MQPIILDIDGSVGQIAGSQRLNLRSWHDTLRFACSMRKLRTFGQMLDAALPARRGTVYLGSGDFHHLSLPLIEQAVFGQSAVQVVVFDNHPDNMRFPFGVHCGSWVWRVAALPQVAHVHVVGITSSDIGLGHAWENHLWPLYRGRVTYWSTGIAVNWARRLGLGSAVRGFASTEALIAAFSARIMAASSPVYLSIDKDALDPAEATSNWDQGRLRVDDIISVIDCVRDRLVGSDITGDISVANYQQWWKRILAGIDGQVAPDSTQLQAWQAGQHAINTRLNQAIAAANR